MMYHYLIFLYLSIFPVSSFTPCLVVTEHRNAAKVTKVSGYVSSQSKRSLFSDFTNTGSLIVATIDSDIANIPTNEFAPVFAGGIVVMFGGLLSALVVGFIIDKRNLYANLVADSYAQGEDDEEFWKGLNEEEKRKTQELLQRVRESKQGALSRSDEPIVPIASSARAEPQAKIAEFARTAAEATPAGERSEIGMFSDYGKD
jgi:hypothetical protein